MKAKKSFFIQYIGIVTFVMFFTLAPNLSSAQSELLTNGGFETGYSGWTQIGDFYVGAGFPNPHSGNSYAYFGVGSDGITVLFNATGALYQTISIPSGATSVSLTFWLFITSDETGPSQYDKLFVEILNSSGVLLETKAIYSNLDKNSWYAQKLFDLASYAGQTIRIQFRGTTDYSVRTVFRVDDVSVIAEVPATLTVGPTSLNFGDVQIGSYSEHEFAIQHVLGTNPASGTVYATAPFQIISGNSFSISNGESASVWVRFTPTNETHYTGTATVNSSATFTNTNTVSLSGNGLNPPPTNGAILIDAKLDGATWNGLVNYSISGPVNFSGNTVPADFQDKPQGAYNLVYISGGPTSATLSSITPSSSQTLIGGGSITFTLNFSTPPIQPPIVNTGVGQPNGETTALIFGTVNPNGAPTDVWFEWGTNTSYGNSTPHISIGNGTSVVQHSEQISNLTPDITYHFRIVGQNSGGTSYGINASFTMPPIASTPPTIKECRVINPTTTFTTLECLVNPEGAPMEAWFEWGTTTDYGNSTTVRDYGGTGNDDLEHTEIITGLSIGTRYYFRYIARNSAGQSTSDQTFIHGASTVYGFKTHSGIAGDPVNITTGNYTYQKNDLTIPGKGIPFIFERTYNSQDNQTGPLGFGWNHSLNTYLTTTPILDDTYIIIRWGDGKTDIYTPDGSGGFIPQNGIFDSLVKNGDGTYTLKKKNLTSYNFNISNKLDSIVDKNGNTITLSYLGTTLNQVTDTAGRNITFTYDESGHITQITDPVGRVLEFSYDLNGDLLSVKDLNGNVTHYTYDVNHQMLTFIDSRNNAVVTNIYDDLKRVSYQLDAAGVKTSYSYDEDNHKTIVVSDATGLIITTTYFYDQLLRLIQETDGKGNSSYFSYNTAGNRTEVRDRNGNFTSYTYDSRGNVLTKIDALSNLISITYDENNNPLTKTDTLGNTTIFEYDGKGNLISTTDPLDNVTTVTYNSHGQPLTVADARGNITTNSYDTQGNLIQVTDALGNISTYTYDGVGRKLTKVDALGNTTTYMYDNNNNLLTLTDPLLNVTVYTYDQNNNRLTITNPMVNTTSYAYDAKDLTISVTDHLGNSITNAYDALDRKISVTDKRGYNTNYFYDEVGNLITLTDPLGNSTSYTYDANGNRLTETNPLGQTKAHVYDALNRVVSITDPLGNTKTNTYDALGRITETTNAKLQTTSFVYDARGRLIRVTDAIGGIVTYSYDENGNRISMTDPNGNTTTYTYDTLNRLVQKVEPHGSRYQYSYDAVGNMISQTDANGNTINYEYDANYRLTKITYPDAPTVTFTYDANGNRTQMVDNVGTTNYSYDAIDRIIEYTDPFGNIVGYGYDPNGNRTTLIYPDGNIVSYTYDALNRLTSVTDWLVNETLYSYDPASNLTEILGANNTKAIYTYDSASRLIGLSNKKSDLTTISSYSYTLDSIGNHLHVVKDEPLDPLLSNKSVTYSYDSENRIVVAGSITFTHDANGNLTQKGSDSFTYDYENRLAQSITSDITNHYEYDGLGNRLSKIEGDITTRYILDINKSLTNVLAETDSGGAITAYYVYGLGLVSKILPDDTVSYYHYDSRGSTVALTDETQNLIDAYAYDSFGNLVNSSGLAHNPFKYVGRYGVMDEGCGLYYIRARYYSPETGRFITKDAKNANDKNTQSLNRYVYALNNPIKLIDISGFSAQEGEITKDKQGSSDEMHTYWIESTGYTDISQIILDTFSLSKEITLSAGRDIINSIIPLIEGGHLETLQETMLRDLNTTGMTATVASIYINMMKEFKSSNITLESLTTGELNLLSKDDWIDSIAQGFAAGSAVAWNTAAGPLNATVRLATGGQIDTSLTGGKIYNFIQRPANWIGKKLFEYGIYP